MAEETKRRLRAITEDLNKLRKAAKICVGHEAEVDAEPLYYEGGDPTPDDYKEAVKYLVAVRQELLPVLGVLAGCGELSMVVGTVSDLRRWLEESDAEDPARTDTLITLDIDSVRIDRGIQFRCDLEFMTFHAPKR